MAKSRTRIKDIARMAGVSEGTVDRVLHNRGEVHPRTRAKVLQIVEKSGYTPNIVARSLATKKNYRIEVLLPEAAGDNPYWALPLKGVIKAIEEIRHFNTQVKVRTFNLNQAATFDRITRQCLSSEPDGVVFPPVFPDLSKKFSLGCESKGIPYVFIDSAVESCNCLTTICQNTMQSGYLAARLMCLSLNPGDHILVVNLAQSNGILHHLQKRERGFLRYFTICPNSKTIGISQIEIDITKPDEPQATLDRIFNEKKKISGIFVTGSKVHKIAEYLETICQRNIFLIGYDLIEANQEYLRNGTIDFLIGQKPEEQGYYGVMSLYRYLVHHTPPDPVRYSPIDIISLENIDYYPTT